MSLLKRLEQGGTGPAALASPRPSPSSEGEATNVAPPEPTFRHNPVQTQASEAQRSLKDRVKRKLISELDPSVDSNEMNEVRLRL